MTPLTQPGGPEGPWGVHRALVLLAKACGGGAPPSSITPGSGGGADKEPHTEKFSLSGLYKWHGSPGVKDLRPRAALGLRVGTALPVIPYSFGPLQDVPS